MRRKVWIVVEMVREELDVVSKCEGKRPDYFLNEIVAVYGGQGGAEVEAKRLAETKGGTYSVFEHELRHSVLM